MISPSSFRLLVVRQLRHLYTPEECEAIAHVVLHDLLNIDRTAAHLQANHALNMKDEISLLKALERLKQGEPVQYVTGVAWFCGLKFSVNPSVLIPRPETEELVNLVLKNLPKPTGENLKIADLCTGSGCIAISLKKQLPHAEITATDISEAALHTARLNADTLLGRQEITFVQADLLSTTSLTGSFDVVVCNPPYVSEADKHHMHPNVLHYEPRLALFAPGSDPLLFYRALATFASGHLPSGGLLCAEINESYGNEVLHLFTGLGKASVVKDLNGKDRMLLVQS